MVWFLMKTGQHAIEILIRIVEILFASVHYFSLVKIIVLIEKKISYLMIKIQPK